MMILRGHCSRSQAMSFQVTVGSNCCEIHSESVLSPEVPFMRASRLPNVRRLPGEDLECPGRAHRDLERIAQREPRRNGQAILRIPAAQSLHGHVDREHDRRAIRGQRTLEQFLVEAAIAHQVDLEPERLLHGAAHVLDRADAHRGQAERHAERLRGARAEHFAVGVEQAGEAGRADAAGNGPLLAENRGAELLRGHVHHHALAQLDRLQVGEIAVERDFVIRAAIGVVEDGARHAPARELAKIGNAVDDHERVWGQPPFPSKRGQSSLCPRSCRG